MFACLLSLTTVLHNYLCLRLYNKKPLDDIMFFCSRVLLLLTVNSILTHVSAHIVTIMHTIMSFCNLCSAAGNKQIQSSIQ